MLKRPLNVGFSGGEKKRNEILQMAMLEPSLCVLDETDSGLDIDAVRVVSDGVNALRSKTGRCSSSPIISGCSNYIVPDRVHVMSDGAIAQVRRQRTGARAGKDRLRRVRSPRRRRTLETDARKRQEMTVQL